MAFRRRKSRDYRGVWQAQVERQAGIEAVLTTSPEGRALGAALELLEGRQYSAAREQLKVAEQSADPEVLYMTALVYGRVLLDHDAADFLVHRIIGQAAAQGVKDPVGLVRDLERRLGPQNFASPGG